MCLFNLAMDNNKIIIAIDGHSSTGKSSFAKTIARELEYIYVDTGAMYRAVTLYAIQMGLIDLNGDINTDKLIELLPQINIEFKFNKENESSNTYLNGKNVEKEIRTIIVSQSVSKISAIPQVREKMVSMQQAMGKNKGLVMDGRDIGTVVFPDAELKLFMTADTKIRAMRRYKELVESGNDVTLDEIEQNIIQRDYEDSNRATSPLRKADDAIILDNSHMTLQEQQVWLKQLITSKQLIK